MTNVVLYPGTFDPMTNGHLDLIIRASNIFDEVFVGVGINPSKKTLFTIEERVTLMEEVLADVENVQVTAFSGLTTDFAIECGANIILRGLRTGLDFEQEFQLNWMNHALAPDLETIFFAPSPEVSGISSTLVKQVAEHGGDYVQFVPDVIARALGNKL